MSDVREEQPKAPQGRGVLRTLWRLSAVAFGLVAVVVALAIGLFRILVPMVPDFHERIEAAAGTVLGVPVQFERLDVRFRLRGPELVFYGAKVFDAERDTTLLEARDGHINLNMGAFLTNRAVVPDVVVLRGLDIEIHQDADGRFSVLGRQASSAEPRPRTRTTNWPLPDGHYVLHEARVRYTRADGDPVIVPRVDVNVDVDGRRLRVDGSLLPPQGMGDALELSAEFDGALSEVDALSWQVYLAGSDLDIAPVGDLMERYPLPFVSGKGDIVAWASFRGPRMQTASLDLNVQDLVARNATNDERYRHLRGRFELDRTALGWRGQAHDVFIDRGGQAWPAVDASLSFDQGQGGERRWHAVVPFARLDDLAPLLAAVPAGRLAELASAYKPVGDVTKLDAVVRVASDGETVVTLEGDFDRLGWRNVGRVPGVQGFSGDIRSDELGGNLNLDSDALTFNAANIFADALEAWRLTGSVSWRETDDGWRVVSDNVLLATEDFDALAQVELLTHGEEVAPDIVLKADIGDMDIVRALRYLPVKIMKPKLVDWLTNALRGGTASSASLNVRGALDQFPYASEDQAGVFEAVLDVEGLALAFGRDWPVATAIDSRVRFEGKSLSATVSNGLFGEARIDSGQVTIDDLKDVVLEISTATSSPLELVSEYFITTPAATRFDALLRDLKPSGPARTALSLSMPIKTWREFDYQVDITPAGARLDYREWPVALEDIRGSVVLNRDGLTAPAATGVFLGRPVAMGIDTVPIALGEDDGSVRTRVVQVRASGRTDANVLAERLHPPLADMLRGSSDWQTTIQFPPLDRPDALPTTVDVTSPLEGLAMLLPAPLAKNPDGARTLTARFEFPRDQDIRLTAQLGDDIQGQFAFEPTNWKLKRCDIALNDGAANMSARDGAAIRGSLPAFDYDAWLAYSSDKPGGLGDLLRTADVQLGELTVFGQTVTDARVTVDRNVREWLIEIESPETSGAIFLPFDFRTTGGPVIANMQSLVWRSGGEDAQGVDPRTLPSLRLDTQSFTYDEMNFGAVSTQIAQAEDGLLIERMTCESPSFTCTADGAWRYADGAPSEFRMTINSTDVKPTLEALGSVGAIDSGDGVFAMDLHWDDELDGGFVRDVYGEVTIAVGDGQLLNVDPKAGRVFGLISLTALPRRLSLDFRDIFQKGFAFDAIEGTFSLRGGNAFTDNLTLRGPAAQVAVTGRAGIATRDYDQTASIYANFGSSLPIAGAIAGGPAVGAALLIFSELFKDPLKQIGRVDYRISGSWDEPQIARLNAPGSEPATPPSEPPTTTEPETQGASD